MQAEKVTLPGYKVPPHLQKYFRPKLDNCYVCHIVQIFRGVERVLRKDGTLWLNLGDSYAGGGHGGHIDNKANKNIVGPSYNQPTGLKPKDLIGIPWRVALALQADGWWLRNDIILAKRNPMPESVTDRCSQSYEHMFLLAKSQKYFFDTDAIREPHNDVNRPSGFKGQDGIGPRHSNQGWAGGNVSLDKHREYNPAGRNKRDVWSVVTEPTPFAHFATFGKKWIEPCILAGTSEKGCCPECGKGWERKKVDKEVPFCDNEQHENKNMQGVFGVDGDKPIQTSDPKNMQPMFGREEEGRLVGKSRTELIKSEVEQGSSQDRNCNPKEKIFPNKPGQSEHEEGVQPVLSENNANGKRSTENKRESEKIFQNGNGQNQRADPMQQKKGVINGGRWNFYGTGLDRDIDETEKQMPLLHQKVSSKDASDNRSCNTSDERRESQQSEYCGSMPSMQFEEMELPITESKTIGWDPGCNCGGELDLRLWPKPIPCTVLDPFMGSGTTALVAYKHGRRFIGIDLSKEYLDTITIPRIENETRQRKLF